jgi:hypothetical protein
LLGSPAAGWQASFSWRTMLPDRHSLPARHRPQPYGPAVGSRAGWAKGRQSLSTPCLAEFIGGPFASSMSLKNRAELIIHFMPDLPPLTVSALFSETLDAVIYLGTGIQPSTKLRTVCDSLHQLRDLCQREYSLRCCEDVGHTQELLDMVKSCKAQSHQVSLVNTAVDSGFQAFDSGAGSSDLKNLETVVALLERQVEMARLVAVTAASTENAAMLACRAATFELKTAEEEAMISSAT